MAQQHVIELAIDLTRMPALARTNVLPALPPTIIELMRIAAASPGVRTTGSTTGRPPRWVGCRPSTGCFGRSRLLPHQDPPNPRSCLQPYEVAAAMAASGCNHNSWDAFT